jgi:hypothetical protein
MHARHPIIHRPVFVLADPSIGVEESAERLDLSGSVRAGNAIAAAHVPPPPIAVRQGR